MTESVIDAPWASTYPVEVDGVPGATGLGILTGVYHIATLPEHRGRGYGRLVTGRMMTDGFDDRLPAVVAVGPSRPGPI